MLRTFRAAAGGLALLLSAAMAWAQVDAATAETLMKKSGAWLQLAHTPAQMRRAILEAAAAAPRKASESELARLAQAAETAYAPERLQSTSRAAIAARLDGRHLAALDAWYDSALGRKVRQLEEAAADDPRDMETRLQQDVALLQSQDAARRALLGEVVEVTRLVELLTDLSINAAIAIQRGVASIAPDASGMTQAELRAMLQAQRPQMMQTYAVVSAATAARIYDTLPADELAQYVAFLKSDAARHYTDVGAPAMIDALVEASAEFGRRLTGTQDRFRS